MQTEDVREKLFTIRMSDEERERADLVAAHYGLNIAGVIRMLIKREADSLAHAPTNTVERLAKLEREVLGKRSASDVLSDKERKARTSGGAVDELSERERKARKAVRRR